MPVPLLFFYNLFLAAHCICRYNRPSTSMRSSSLGTAVISYVFLYCQLPKVIRLSAANALMTWYALCCVFLLPHIVFSSTATTLRFWCAIDSQFVMYDESSDRLSFSNTLLNVSLSGMPGRKFKKFRKIFFAALAEFLHIRRVKVNAAALINRRLTLEYYTI